MKMGGILKMPPILFGIIPFRVISSYCLIGSLDTFQATL